MQHATVTRVAIAIGKCEIKTLPVQAYETVRNDLRSGAWVFCAGACLFSGLIQRFTKSV